MAEGSLQHLVVDRLTALSRQLDHLQKLRPRVTTAETLRRDLTLHNNVLYSLLVVCQATIDIAGELAARRGQRFENHTEALRSLTAYPEFPESMVGNLEPLPGLRNALIQECVARDLERVVQALERLEPLEEFAEAVRRLEQAEG